MIAPVHVVEAAAEAAWERYEEASARAARFLRGETLDLFDTAQAEAREWFGICMACDSETVRARG